VSSTHTTWVFADTVGTARCRDERCGARITWGEIVKTGKRMCFDGELVALRTDVEQGSGPQVWEVDLADNHWATCPAAKDFKRR
jgi:hypothetical protein